MSKITLDTLRRFATADQLVRNSLNPNPVFDTQDWSSKKTYSQDDLMTIFSRFGFKEPQEWAVLSEELLKNPVEPYIEEELKELNL